MNFTFYILSEIVMFTRYHFFRILIEDLQNINDPTASHGLQMLELLQTIVWKTLDFRQLQALRRKKVQILVRIMWGFLTQTLLTFSHCFGWRRLREFPSVALYILYAILSIYSLLWKYKTKKKNTYKISSGVPTERLQTHMKRKSASRKSLGLHPSLHAC